MKTHVADNLMLFRKYFNDIYHRVRNYERDRDHYILEEGRNGSPTLQVHRNDERYYLHSNYNPEREADKWLEHMQDEIQHVKQVIFYGIGLGYHLEAFIRKYPDKSIYLYEPDAEVLQAAIEARNLGKILKHAKIAVFGFGPGNYTLDRFVQYFVEQVSQEHKVLIPPSYVRAYAEQIQTFQKEMQNAVLRYRGNMHTFLAFREEWPENILMNMAKNVSSTPINKLENAAKDIPVVIVGSGPSLDLDKEYLNKVAERALIFAAGSSIQALLAMGIVPDMIFSIDGSEKNYEIFKKLEYEEVPFLYCPFVRHKIIEEKQKHLFHVVMTNDTISQHLLKEESLKKKFHSTTSVTGTVLQAAALLGCNPIVLMGQDLSYPGGKFYAGAVNHFSEEELDQQRKKVKLTVENVQGGLNDISKPMLNTLRDMEMTLEIFNRNSTVINTSKVGALIRGTEHQEIETLLQQSLTNKLDKKFYYTALSEVQEQYGDEEKTEIYQGMEKLKDDLENMEKAAMGLLEDLDTLKQTRQGKLEAMIDDIDKKWLALVRDQAFERVVAMTIQTQLMTYKRYLPQIKEEADMKVKADLIYKNMGLVAAGIVRSVPSLKKKLDEGMVKYRSLHFQSAH